MKKDTVGYFPTVDAPVTKVNAIFEIVNNANSIKNSRNLILMIDAMD